MIKFEAPLRKLLIFATKKAFFCQDLISFKNEFYLK